MSDQHITAFPACNRQYVTITYNRPVQSTCCQARGGVCVVLATINSSIDHGDVLADVQSLCIRPTGHCLAPKSTINASNDQAGGKPAGFDSHVSVRIAVTVVAAVLILTEVGPFGRKEHLRLSYLIFRRPPQQEPGQKAHLQALSATCR